MTEDQKIAELEAEIAEQARLLGASGSREAALLTKIAELELEVRRWKSWPAELTQEQGG